MTSLPAEERIGSHIKRAEQALLAAKNTALKPAAVTVPQYAALLWLSEKPGISAAALSRLCGVTPPTMNTVLKNLQERGLIERTPHEWHRNVLETRLTEQGHAVMELADTAAVRVERQLAAEFGAEERERLIELLGRCARVLDDLR
ncbi:MULTISPECIES: MarR family winged helix-turn-helix transcriptional regulator [unclassified Streptomyces]|uniref:MarR family winged helix-turn-helix transcriptional regulator n=1 Tax=unclassified Streptomyces TaxID=2593676 RepID=UPI00109EC96C|nr:MarR family transcriptional regulator [Streptomyces sp. A1136]THA55067.1 MarR family transcriptional regulator [Streptomyces sp. A1136]